MLMERLKAAPRSGSGDGLFGGPRSAPQGRGPGLRAGTRLKQAPPQLRDAVLNKAPGNVNVASAGGA